MPIKPFLAAAGVLVIAAFVFAAAQQHEFKYGVHDENRPQPKVVVPAPYDQPHAPPSDAIVLFDGDDLDAWQHKGGPAKWKLADGYFEIVKKTGTMSTKQQFGDMQLHIEWAAPTQISGDGQGRGNSGIFLMGMYEVQVLDSHDNKTYPDGQAGSIYGQHPPLVNAMRKPGEWNTYDILFRRPRFNDDGSLAEPGYVTLIHNGVVVQNHAEILGRATHKKRAQYKPHGDVGPLTLQDHGNPVRFRNIWVRPLTDSVVE